MGGGGGSFVSRVSALMDRCVVGRFVSRVSALMDRCGGGGGCQ